MRVLALLLAIVSAAAFAPSNRAMPRTAPLPAVELANGKMSFDRVCREWRCKYEGDKVTSASLEAIAGVVDEYLPTLKALDPDATITRMVCGGCLDFKLLTTVPLEKYGEWESAGHPPEAEFLEKLKAIDGVSMVETQTITNMVL